MADTWGGSFGASWAASWGAGVTPAVSADRGDAIARQAYLALRKQYYRQLQSQLDKQIERLAREAEAEPAPIYEEAALIPSDIEYFPDAPAYDSYTDEEVKRLAAQLAEIKDKMARKMRRQEEMRRIVRRRIARDEDDAIAVLLLR